MEKVPVQGWVSKIVFGLDMSIRLLNELKFRTAGSASLRAVLRSLCEFSNDTTGKCNPSLSTLLQDTELSKPTLLNCLSILEATGVVERISGNACQSSSYFVNLEKLSLNKAGKLRDSVKNSETIKNIETDLLQNENDEEGRLNILPSEEILPRSNIDTRVGKEFNQGLVKNLTKGRENICTRVGKKFDHKTLIETKKETLIETNKETYKNDDSFSVDDELPLVEASEVVETEPVFSKPKTEKKSRSTGTATKKQTSVTKPDDVSDDLWADFLAHRKQKKAIVSERVINTIRNEAKIAGWTLEEALDEVILRDWRGFKAEWVKDEWKDPNAKWITADDFYKDLEPVTYSDEAKAVLGEYVKKGMRAYNVSDIPEVAKETNK